MDIGDRIREARIKAKYSQVDVARALKVDQSCISQWERGVGPGPRLRDAVQLCALLGCDLRWLTFGVGKMGAAA